MGPGLGMPGLPAPCVCTRPSWQGLALQGPPAQVGTHCGSEPTGSYSWSCPGVVPGTRPAQGDGGESILLALAGGSDGTRHKHLEHTYVRVCVPHAWAHMWHTWACTYTWYTGAVQALSWYAPLHAPLHPVAPLGAVGALLGGQASPTKLGTATSSVGTAQCCCLPHSGAGGWVLKPGRGVTRWG